MLNSESVGLDRIRNLEIMLGNECNQQCIFCYQEDQSARHVMPNSVWREMLLPVYPYLESIKFHGGEPTIMRNAREMVDFLGRDFPQIRLMTISNGQRFDKFWQDCFLSRGSKVIFSVHAASSTTHQRIVQRSRFDDTIRNILTLVERRERELSELQIHMSFVVTCENHQEAVAFIQLAENLQVDCCIFSLDFVRNLSAHYSGIKASMLLARDTAITSSVKVVGLEGILSQLGEPVVLTRSGNIDFHKAKCPVPWQNLSINQNGSVSLCNAAWLTLGNLMHQDIETLWKSPVAVKTRQRIANGDYSMCKKSCMFNINPSLRGGPVNHFIAVRRYLNTFSDNPIGVLQRLLKRLKQRYL